jgi:hypothetical protein
MLVPLVLASRTISFRPDLQVMVVRWHTQAPLDVVQADYDRMLASAEASGLSEWLLDVRRREKITAELSDWVTNTFYAEAVAYLAPKRLRLTVLSSPALSEAYRSDSAQKQYVAYVLGPSRPYDVALFEDEGAAMRWLCAEKA